MVKTYRHDLQQNLLDEMAKERLQWQEYLKLVAKAKETEKQPIPETITADNLYRVAQYATIKALNVAYCTSGLQMLAVMVWDILDWEENDRNDGKDGADLVQDLICYYLKDYIGANLADDNGNGVPVIVGAFRFVHSKIHDLRKRSANTVYLTDYNGDEIAVPARWDMPDYDTFVNVDNIIKSLELTDRQNAILSKRLQGFSLSQIGEKYSISKQAIKKTLDKIGEKYKTLYNK